MMFRTVRHILFALPLAAFARPHVSLPPPAFADTETTTNVLLSTGTSTTTTRVGDLPCFRFALTFHGTPSNNVQVPRWLHDPDWNILRLTGRGADELRDSFLLLPGGTTIRIR